MKPVSFTPRIGQEILKNSSHAIARFLHDGCEDETNRSMAVASMLFSLWQMSKGPMTHSLPSALLVQAADDVGGDPIDELFKNFIFNNQYRHEESLKDEELNGFKPRENCLIPPARGMASSMSWAQSLPRESATFATQCNLFHTNRINAVGAGPAYRYSRAWHDDYGWLGHENKWMVLRLHEDDDREMLHQDLLEEALKLRSPEGIGSKLQRIRMQLALSGSLPARLWDSELVDALIQDGWPVLFLPHTTNHAFDIPSGPDMAICLWNAIIAACKNQTHAVRVIPEDPWLDHFHRVILKRLAHMPPDYAFNIQRIFRELHLTAMRITMNMCPRGWVGDTITIIGMDLFRSTVRAMAIGVASLSYHGWGFEAAASRQQVRMLLEHLRNSGPLTRRDLQRKFPLWLGADRRDVLIDQLESLGLLKCDGSQLSAVPLPEFIHWLGQHEDFPSEGCLSSLLLGHKCLPETPLPGTPQKPKRRRKPRKKPSEEAQAAESATQSDNAPEKAV